MTVATKLQLMGSFNSLSDSLAFRFDPAFPRRGLAAGSER